MFTMYVNMIRLQTVLHGTKRSRHGLVKTNFPLSANGADNTIGVMVSPHI